MAQEGFLGEIRLFAGNFAPRSWAFCEGQLLPISQNTALFSILGKYVELTIDEKDNNKLHNIMATKKYKMFAFIVDLLASVKLPKLKGK